MDIADRIFSLADAKFPEQKDFAAALEITPSIVSEWRRGKSSSYTKPKTITKIAKVLDTSVEYLLTGNPDDKPPVDQLADGWEKEVMQLLRGLPAATLAREMAYLRSLAAEQGK